MPRFVKEIIITVCSYIVLCLIWYFFVGEYITLSDSGLSTIGMALSASVGSLTALVVSFVLIIWQFSRKERNDNFFRWKETLNQLHNYYEKNGKLIKSIYLELSYLHMKCSSVSLIRPMTTEHDKLFIKFEEKFQKENLAQLNALSGKDKSRPVNVIIEKNMILNQVSYYLTLLETAGVEHRASHNLYVRILSLRRLLYRLLVVLASGVSVVLLANVGTSLGILDMFNMPLTIILVSWFIYVLVCLGSEIKRVSRLEEEFKKRDQSQSKQ